MIVGAAIAPHGSLILPALNKDERRESKIHQSMKKLAQHIEELKPDIILLSTPHGISLETAFGIYENEKAFGTAEWKDNYKQFNVSVQLDMKGSTELVKKLKEKDLKVEGITTFSALEPIPLRWGEVVPLWFLQNIPAKYIIITQPSRRVTQALDMIPELVLLGQELASYLQSLSQRVFILISGDMAHTYQSDGPYGIHPSSRPFDSAVEKWTKTLDRKFLVEEAGSMLYSALACGFTGFVMLDSIMKSLRKNDIKSNVFCNLHPSYYGMMVAVFNFSD